MDLADIPAHLRAEISHFFDVYKELEPGKSTDVRGWQDRAAAEKKSPWPPNVRAAGLPRDGTRWGPASPGDLAGLRHGDGTAAGATWLVAASSSRAATWWRACWRCASSASRRSASPAVASHRAVAVCSAPSRRPVPSA